MRFLLKRKNRINFAGYMVDKCRTVFSRSSAHLLSGIILLSWPIVQGVCQTHDCHEKTRESNKIADIIDFKKFFSKSLGRGQNPAGPLSGIFSPR
jgi:hypothetical protein